MKFFYIVFKIKLNKKYQTNILYNLEFIKILFKICLHKKFQYNSLNICLIFNVQFETSLI